MKRSMSSSDHPFHLRLAERLRRGALLLVAAWCCLLAAPALAQSDDEEPPEPRAVNLTTKDGLALRAEYYESLEGKEAVPVVMIHMHEGRRNDYHELALFLQREHGHAVMVPDLRGHGDSTKFADRDRPLAAKSLRPADFAAMIQQDLEACKSFLLAEHNEGRLNIEKLCVVGAEMGCVLALNWALLDWSWPPLATGKQGQDVMAVVLLSPEWSFRNLNLTRVMGHPDVRSKISIYMMVGKGDTRAVRQASRVYKAFQTHHADQSELELADRDLLGKSFDTSLQGTKLLGEGFGVAEEIAAFIDRRLVQQDIPWRSRTIPLAQ